MEEMQKNKIGEFAVHVTFFMGLMSYLVFGLLLTGIYRVQWQRIGSVNLTAINAEDTEQLTKNIYIQQETDTRSKKK